MRLLLLLIVVILVTPYSSLSGKSALAQTVKIKPERLNGAYEFISEVTVLTKPVKLTDKRDNTTWLGQWLFHDGRFSQTLMKINRRPFLALPKTIEALGFESFAGSYETNDRYIELTHNLSLHTADVGLPMSFEYSFEGDVLILKETLRPHREDLSEGTRTIRLKRINK